MSDFIFPSPPDPSENKADLVDGKIVSTQIPFGTVTNTVADGGALTTETTNRTNADITINSRIDGLSSGIQPKDPAVAATTVIYYGDRTGTNAYNFRLGGGRMYYGTTIRLPVLATGAVDYIVRIGLMRNSANVRDKKNNNNIHYKFCITG